MRDSRQQLGGNSWLRQARTARVTASIANHITWLRFCLCSSRNCGVCESLLPTCSSFGRVCETSDSKWGSNGRHSRVRKSGAAGTPVYVTAGECDGVRDRSDCKIIPIHG